MREINEFLDLVFKHHKSAQKKITDLKSEMKYHLLETVHELEADGLSHQESVRIAIERFGDAENISKELPEVLIFPRRRFFTQLIISSGVVSVVIIVLIANLILSSINNRKNIEKLEEAQAVKEIFSRELLESHGEYLSNKDSMIEIAKLIAVYCNSTKLSSDLSAEYNINVIDDIAKMNKTFRYHNGVLIAVAIIASETDYDCPYFKELAQLGVMKLSGSNDVILVAEKAREAKTEEDFKYIDDQIQLLKAGAEFTTYEEALYYNNSY